MTALFVFHILSLAIKFPHISAISLNRSYTENTEQMNKYLAFVLLTILPTISFAQFSEAFREMSENKNAEYEDYQELIFEASNYIFANPVDQRSVEFISATQIVGFWINKETGMNIPAFGDFFTSLTNENHQQFLYTIAMINYGLEQKLNYNRVLKCERIKGQKFDEQEDVREVQLNGAKILLAYMENPGNNVPLAPGTKKYMEAYKKDNLEREFFED